MNDLKGTFKIIGFLTLPSFLYAVPAAGVLLKPDLVVKVTTILFRSILASAATTKLLPTSRKM